MAGIRCGLLLCLKRGPSAEAFGAEFTHQAVEDDDLSTRRGAICGQDEAVG